MIGLTVAIVQLLVGGTTLIGIVGILNMLLVAATIVRDRARRARPGRGQPAVGHRRDLHLLLLGICFTFVYYAVAVLGSGTFFAQGTDGTPSLQLYFSYVTLATLGYGDYTPATTLGHTLAVSEALLGQLYLVTVVALLVGNLSRQRDAALARLGPSPPALAAFFASFLALRASDWSAAFFFASV